MLTRRILSVTVVVQTICWTTIALLFLGGNGRTVQAIPFYQVAPPEPFLGSIYYGQEEVWNVFDHEYPLFGGDNATEPNDRVRHYDGTNHKPPFDGYGYDAHIGIDYHLVYEPVLAAAMGTVHYAGWSDPTNHRAGYGLHVQMNHTANANYRAWYGHFSSLVVETGDGINVPYGDRGRILGISGNTGNLLGCDDPVGVDPLCSAHLHFEVRQISGNLPVNPYGWIGLEQSPPVTDPWSVTGATSYNLWANRPDVTTDQYPSGTPVEEPTTNEYLIEVDDSNSALFTTYGDCFGQNCWTSLDHPDGLYGNYHYAPANKIPVSYAQWSFDPTVFAPAGEYDVYVRIPDPASSLSAEYEIYGHGVIHKALVVQAAYPNPSHDNWVYIGRYEFDLNGSGEYIRLNIQNSVYMGDDTNYVLLADAIRLLPAESPPTIEVAVATSTDDAGLNYLCSYWVAHNEIYLGHCANGTSIVSGFRFPNVSVPQGAAISAARLEFTVDGSYTTNIDVQFRGELVADAAAFSDTSRPSDRSPLTTAAVPWHVGSEDEWLTWRTRHSPDLSAVIQEIVNQSGWVSGNDLVIIVRPSGSGTTHRRVFAWDRNNNELQTARLQVWYTESPPPPLPSPPAKLKAVYDAGAPPGADDYIPKPPRVALTWFPAPPPPGTTFNVYRGHRIGPPIPLDAAHRIASGVTTGTYDDYEGQVGDIYVVTAVNAAGESSPSNTAYAR